MRQRLFITAVTAFWLAAGALYIRQVKRLALGQQIREEGPQKHLKVGTPTRVALSFAGQSSGDFPLAPKALNCTWCYC